MTRPDLLPLLAALVAGAAAGAVTALGLAPTSQPREPGPAPGAAPTALEQRLEALARENRRLQERVAALEVRPATPAPEREPVGGYATAAELEALREEFERWVDPRERPTAPEALAGEELETQVAEALQQVRKQEAIEYARKAQDGRLERLDQDVERLTERLQLSPDQADAMRRALSVQYEREASLILAWEAGVDDAVVGEQKQTVQAEFQSDLEGFLSPEQLEDFWGAVLGK